MPQRCSTCKTEVLFVRNVKTGNRMIVDAEPIESVNAADGVKPGMVAVVGEKGRVLTKADIQEDAIHPRHDVHPDVSFHLSHWATCPQREQHRLAREARRR